MNERQELYLLRKILKIFNEFEIDPQLFPALNTQVQHFVVQKDLMVELAQSIIEEVDTMYGGKRPEI